MMSLLDISVRLIGFGRHRLAARRISGATAVLVAGTFLVLGTASPSSGTAGVLDRLRRKKPSTGTAVVTIPTVSGSSDIANTSHEESAGGGDAGPACTTCSDGDCEHGSDIGFWRRMANKMSDHKRRWRRKMYFEYHFSNKKMLYPVCPPFGTANYGYFPTCWRQFPETYSACPPRQLLEPSSADAPVQPPSSASPQPVPPPSPKQPVPVPPPAP